MDRSKQLGEENISTLLLKFSIPAIVGMVVNAMYNIVDRIFIGNGIGSLGIAGITIGFPIMLIIMAFGMLIGIGATSLISIRLGEDKKDEAELIMGNGIVLLIVISAVISFFGLIFLDPLLELFGASSDVLPYAKEYMGIILMGTVFMSISFGMNNFIRAEGNPKIAMYTMLIGAFINIVLDYIFIFVFMWGMQGAALATVIAQIVSAVWVVSYFLNGNSTLKIRLNNLSIQPEIARTIVKIGSAPFSVQMAASLLTVILNNTLNTYGGDIAIAAMGVLNSFVLIILMPVFGINQGAQPIIGYNYGARNHQRVIDTLKLAVIAGTIIVIIGFVFIQLYPAQIVALFNPEDDQLIEFGVLALRIYLLFLPIVGFQIIGANYFQAVGKPKEAIFLSLSRQILILIPLILILPRFLGVYGILFAGPISDFLAALITAFLLFRELRLLNKPDPQPS